MQDSSTDLSPYLDFDLKQIRTPRCLYQIQLDLFRMTEMARTWLEENQVAPYKLALLAGVSTSQTHRTLHDDWRPSPRLLARVARALPHDWVSDFERDCDAVLPCSMHHMPLSDTQNRLHEARDKTGDCDSLEAFCDYLRANDFTFATVDQSDGPFKFRTVYTADPRLEQVARERGYITPFFRPLALQHQKPGQTGLAILRHPIIVGPDCFTSTYWLLQFRAFDTSFFVSDRMAFAPVSNDRQTHIVQRFYDVFVPNLIEQDGVPKVI